MSTNEYANKRAIVAAGLSPVPEVGDEVNIPGRHRGSRIDDVVVGVYDDFLAAKRYDAFAIYARLIRRGSTVIPEED